MLGLYAVVDLGELKRASLCLVKALGMTLLRFEGADCIDGTGMVRF